jgi:hypothetical protein
VETKNYVEVSEEERQLLQEQYYEKPDKDLVIKQFKKIYADGVMMDKITKYYFRPLMAQTQIYTAKWTVADIFESRELLGMFKAKTLNNKKVFPDDKPLIKNIQTAIDIGGKGYAKIPTQFPIKACKEILCKYNVNGNFYDFSCGWGARLVGALSKNINYFGTDPNYLLVDKLNELAKDWHEKVSNKSSVDIRPVGSENLQKDWIGKMGLAFSSPPYFNLEDYKIGKQSYTDGMSYSTWLENYLYPTINNVREYLIPNGYFCINIKSFNGNPLVEDVLAYSEKNGFELVDKVPLKNIKRPKSVGGSTDSDEIIYVFKKNV